jgi:DNA (cytosine-5)-methyltransferase 1
MAFTFIDLFAGIGGFHAALEGLGGECVYAVEIDEAAAKIYEHNWGMNPLGDITEDVSENGVKVPKHDVLVAGFPCQPFSKSGAQRGMDETRGTLYWNILKIIEKRKPALVLLENVRNLAGPRHTHEWNVIIQTLREQGYSVSEEPGIFSPHLLPLNMGGRPQVRERVFIVAVKNSPRSKLNKSAIGPVVSNKPVNGWQPLNWNLENDLPLEGDSEVKDCGLSKSEMIWIDAWNEFVVEMYKLRGGERLPGFPLWGDEWVTKKNLQIPPGTPQWKENYLVKNSDFYTQNKKFIDTWAKKWNFYSDAFPPSRRKLEWQAQESRKLWDTLMHFRPSGIRAKRPTYVPALVAITQTSIVGKKKRRLSVREAARLQGFPDWFNFGDQPNTASYKQLGNGVCVGVVWHVMKQAVEQFEDILKKTCPQLVQDVLNSPTNPNGPLKKLKSSHKANSVQLKR